MELLIPKIFDGTRGKYDRIFYESEARSEPREPSKWMKDRLSNQTLIDLGSGGLPRVQVDKNRVYGTPIGTYAYKAGCKRLIAIDPNNIRENLQENMGQMEIVGRKTDGLTFLLSQPDNSAIIIANGLFGSSGPLSRHNNPNAREIQEYANRLISEIYRVTPSVFFGSAIDLEYIELAKKLGFKSVSDVEQVIFDIKPKILGIDLFLFEK